MANVQFGGLITGLDTKELIAGLVAAESRPIETCKVKKLCCRRAGRFIPLWPAVSAV